MSCNAHSSVLTVNEPGSFLDWSTVRLLCNRTAGVGVETLVFTVFTVLIVFTVGS
jgi:hypothetical protein